MPASHFDVKPMTGRPKFIVRHSTYCHFDVAIKFSLVVLYLTLSSQYIKMPTTNEEMSKTMFGFYAMCQFPRVLGAVDRSHVKIQSPGPRCTIILLVIILVL
jgi:hypothetical protein